MDIKDVIKAFIPEFKAQVAENVNVSKSGDHIIINVNFYNFNMPVDLPKDADPAKIAKMNITREAEQAIIEKTSTDLSEKSVTIHPNLGKEDFQLIVNATATSIAYFADEDSLKNWKR